MLWNWIRPAAFSDRYHGILFNNARPNIAGGLAEVRPRQRERLQAMADRHQLIRDASCWAVALSVGLALSTTTSEASRLGGGHPPARVGEKVGDGLGSPPSLLVGHTRPPMPLVVRRDGFQLQLPDLEDWRISPVGDGSRSPRCALLFRLAHMWCEGAARFRLAAAANFRTQSRGPPLSKALYRERDRVVRFFNRLKQFRRIATPTTSPASTCVTQCGTRLRAAGSVTA